MLLKLNIGIVLLLAVSLTMAGEKSESAAAEVKKGKEVKEKLVVIETTMGVMKARLFREKAPETAKNFQTLIEKGYYDKIIFHRVIDKFMIQGGDPTGTGSGGPGYKIKDEFHPDLKHTKKGLFSMANSGPNTGGSQFFITLAATPWLDNKHAIFGEVTEGIDVLEAIGKVKTGPGDRPVKEVVMTKVYMSDK